MCNFLDKPIPTIPIPHDNKTSDPNGFDKIIFDTPYWAETKSYMMWNAAKILGQAALVGSSIVLYKTGGWPLNDIVTTTKDLFVNYFRL